MPTRGIVLGLFGLLMAMAILILALMRFGERRQPARAPANAIPTQSTATNRNPSPVGTPGSLSVTNAPSASAPIGANPEGMPLPEITFDTPQENEAVPRTFQVSGHCSRIPPEQHLILAIQTGKVFSPKWPPMAVQGDTWSGRAMEYGVRTGGSFTLCVFQVTDAGLEEISIWDAEGVKTRRWPPFREIPGGTLLGSIKLTVAGQPKP
jgi:hypothetical protein